MTDHVWTLEQIAAYLAGGLDAMERERLEAHVRDCAECAAALERSRRLDLNLDALFASSRPGPELEDRTLVALRFGRELLPVRSAWRKRVAVAAGITLFATAVGFVGSRARSFPTPWNLNRENYAWNASGTLQAVEAERMEAEARRASADEEMVRGLTRQDANRWSERGAFGEVTAIDKRNATPTVLPETLGAPTLSQSSTNALGLPGLVPPKEPKVSAAGGENGTSSGYALGVPSTPSTAQNGIYFGLPSGIDSSPSNQGGGFRPDDHKPAQAPVKDKKEVASLSMGAFGRSGGTDGVKAAAEQKGEKEVFFRQSTGKENDRGANPALPGISPTISDASSSSTVAQPKPTSAPDAGSRTVVIRSGDIEFEVESFDAAAATVAKLVLDIKGAFIVTTNSDKLTNGKVKGSIVVRLPPDRLDGLLLDLRKELGKGGQLMGVRIGSQDITKQYTDLEGRLKAARTMEQRLLQIIKEGKGEIKQLLDAEKELGIWRIKIEEAEGEIRYYSNLVSLSTLTVELTEKEIKASAGVMESERIQAGVEVEDVEKAYREIAAAVTEAKGRVTKSEVKQLSAGQFNATIFFEVAPELAGPMQDRLRQAGRVARFEIDRLQEPEGAIAKNAKVQRGDTLFQVQLYNLANVEPREVAILQVAVLDVPVAYRALREAVAKTTSRVLTAQLNEQDRQNITAQFDFEVRRVDEGSIRGLLDTLGEVMKRNVVRLPESNSTTDTKVMYRFSIVSANQLKPRERTNLTLEVADVDQTAIVFGDLVAKAKGRQVDSQYDRDRSGRLTAKIVYELPLAAASGVVERFKSSGDVRAFQSTRDPQAPDGMYATARLEVKITNADRIVGVDDGLWPQVRQGLTYSASVLLTSITWVVFGLCVVLPWAAIGYGGYRGVCWLLRSKRLAPSATTSV